MASKAQYSPNVRKELANAWDKARKDSPCQDSIEAATVLVNRQFPIYDVVNEIILAMKNSTNESVLYSLSQAIAWIGPMGE